MQAIQTKYHGPTNMRGARISARCEAGRKIVHYDDALGVEGNHEAAAKLLARSLGWLEPCEWRIHSGALPDGTYAHVLVRY